MSAKIKKAGRFGTNIVAAFLFVFLVMFNVQIGMHDWESGDISLFGLKLSVFVPNAIATGDQWTFRCDEFPGCAGGWCYQGNYIGNCVVYCPNIPGRFMICDII